MKTLLPWRPSLVSPFTDFGEFENRMRQMLSRTWPEFESPAGIDFVPAMNLTETDGEFQLTAELPGLDAKNVDVNVENNVLTIRGEKKEEHEKKEEKRHLWERAYGMFERSLTLPSKADGAKVKAAFANGVLTVTIPKRAEGTGRKIPITT